MLKKHNLDFLSVVEPLVQQHFNIFLVSSSIYYQETSVGNQSYDVDEEENGAYVVNSVSKVKKESRRSRAKKKLLNSYTGL